MLIGKLNIPFSKPLYEFVIDIFVAGISNPNSSNTYVQIVGAKSVIEG